MPSAHGYGCGVLILDGEGRLIERFFFGGEGLQNNTVLSVLSDRDSNLWLGLDNGISFIHYNTSVKLIRPVRDNQLMSNAVKVFDREAVYRDCQWILQYSRWRRRYRISVF